STQDEGRSALDLVPRTACFQNWDSRSTPPPEQVWDSVSTPPPGQVDTLRKNPNLRWMIATCHPRAMAPNWPSIISRDPTNSWSLQKVPFGGEKSSSPSSALLVDTTPIPCRHTP
ncbi:hypothetical protein Taro_034206, partial [Colocasia esculenta]|nr:hypothetical protein [Colocasia esculenta]